MPPNAIDVDIRYVLLETLYEVEVTMAGRGARVQVESMEHLMDPSIRTKYARVLAYRLGNRRVAGISRAIYAVLADQAEVEHAA